MSGRGYGRVQGGQPRLRILLLQVRFAQVAHPASTSAETWWDFLWAGGSGRFMGGHGIPKFEGG